jgi:general secretion pathway protein K
MWPPTLSMAKDSKLMESDKDDMKDSMKESLMQAQYTTTIAPEGGRLDINDLGSDSKAFAKIMAQQVLDIFKAQMEHDEAFRRKYSGFRFEELVNNIADYVDPDTESRNGGDESGLYQDINSATVKLPPNRGFRTLDELHQVAGMTDELFDVLAPRVTVFGTKGINVNYAPKNVLMSLDISMNDTAVDKVIERRGNPKIGGPFKDDKDFFGFLDGYQVNTKAMKDSKFPFFYDVEFNFRIVSTGLSSNVKRDITVVTYDYPNLAQRLAKILTDQDTTDGRTPSPAPKPNPDLKDVGTGSAQVTGNSAQKPKIQSAKGRPTVVYWEEN